MNKCGACEEPFVWDDEVINVNDTLYHKDCIKLYPIGYVAYLDDEFLGETENEDGQMACEILEDLLDDDEEDNSK